MNERRDIRFIASCDGCHKTIIFAPAPIVNLKVINHAQKCPVFTTVTVVAGYKPPVGEAKPLPKFPKMTLQLDDAREELVQAPSNTAPLDHCDLFFVPLYRYLHPDLGEYHTTREHFLSKRPKR